MYLEDYSDHELLEVLEYRGYAVLPKDKHELLINALTELEPRIGSELWFALEVLRDPRNQCIY